MFIACVCVPVQGAFGGLLSGQSTAEDLMESFGFESEPASAETSGRKTLAPPVRKTGGSGSRELSELPSKGRLLEYNIHVVDAILSLQC